MKNQIVIDPEVLSDLTAQLKRLSSSLQDCQQSVSRINLTADTGANISLHSSTRLTFTGYQMRAQNAQEQLESTKTALKKISSETESLARAVTRVKDIFEENERELVGKIESIASGNDIGGQYQAGVISWGMVDYLFQHEPLVGPDTRQLFKESETIDLGELSKEMANGGADDDNDSLFGRFAKLACGASCGMTNSIYSMRSTQTSADGRTTTDYMLDVGKLDIGAGYDAHLFTEVTDVFGNKYLVFSPGVEAHGGASYTVLDTEISSEYELIDGVTLSSKSNLVIGKIGVNADGKIGFYDGEFVAQASGSAEVILLEASQEYGVEVGGVKAKGSAGVSVGLGAHGKVGYKDGTFSYDFGAAVGIGVTMKGEIDVSGLVENIRDGMVKIDGNISEFVGDVSDSVSEFVDDVGQGAKRFVNDVGKGAEKFVGNVGKGAKKFVSGLGNSISGLF